MRREHASKKKAGSQRPMDSVPKRSRRAQLNALVEEATVDCFNDSEQATGLYTMIEDNLELPFQTQVLGVAVTVERIDLNVVEDIVAVCKRGDQKQRISLLDIPLPSPPPPGVEWIEAYRQWRRSGQ